MTVALDAGKRPRDDAPLLVVARPVDDDTGGYGRGAGAVTFVSSTLEIRTGTAKAVAVDPLRPPARDDPYETDDQSVVVDPIVVSTLVAGPSEAQ